MINNRHDTYFLYILRDKHNRYYTGYTRNLNERINLHNQNRGSKYLKGRLPVTLVYAKQYNYFKNVLRAEKRFKKLTRKDKEEYIAIYAKTKNIH